MATRLSWLQTCPGKDLRLLARAIGASYSGTKPALCAQIESTVASPFYSRLHHDGFIGGESSKATREGALSAPPSLISIDMGVKNLAYCHIQPSSPLHPRPRLLDWQRLDVLKPSQAPSSSSSAQGSDYAYHPSTFSLAANSTIHTLLRNAGPETCFVIERQRFRSMGGKGVFEWTIKVNMLEGMVWAVLAGLRGRGQWRGEVMGVRAEGVDGFWMEGGGQVGGSKPQVREARGEKEAEHVEGEVEEERAGKGRKKVGEKKKGTIEMVRHWLESRKVETDDRATETKELYLNGKKKGKLDDLADCVAQGMAVLKWAENRRAILDHTESKPVMLHWDI